MSLSVTWVMVIALIGGLSLAVVMVVAKWCCHRLRTARRAATHAHTTAATVAGAYARVLRGHDPPPLHLPRPTHSPPKRWTRLHRPLVIGITAATAVALAFTLVPAVSPGTTYVRGGVPAGPGRQGAAAPVPDVSDVTLAPERTPDPSPPPPPEGSPAGGGPARPGDPDLPGGEVGGDPSDGGGSGGGTRVDDGPEDDGPAQATTPPAETTSAPQPDDGGKDPLLACIELLGLELCV